MTEERQSHEHKRVKEKLADNLQEKHDELDSMHQLTETDSKKLTEAIQIIRTSEKYNMKEEEHRRDHSKEEEYRRWF